MATDTGTVDAADFDPDPDRGPRRTALWIVFVLVLFALAAGVWATFAQLDVAVQARGAVEAPSRVQEVQSLEGGIVQKLLVRVGQRVRQGDLLVQLDTAQYAADVGENRQQHVAALAGRARTDALLSGTAPRFEPQWRQAAGALIDKEAELWRDGQRELDATRSAAAEVARQREGELREAQSRIQSLEAEMRVTREAFAIEERLFSQGAGARADYLAAQQRVLSQQTELQALQQSLPRLRAALAESHAALAQSVARLRTQWGSQRSEFETRAASLAQALGGQTDKLTRRELHAPTDGVVNRVLVPTLGGVAAPGKAILEIVPDEARLQMTARIQPSEVGFLHPGQRARVRVLPYDASTFGQMDAQLDRVGADALLDEKGNAYFEVQLSAARDQIRLHGTPLPVSPGMPVDVSILTGERSVLQYLLKPVLRGVQSALQER